MAEKTTEQSTYKRQNEYRLPDHSRRDNNQPGLLASICYIWWLEMKNSIKDEGVLIFFILVPLAYPLLYSWIYNNEVVRDVPVAVIDNDNSIDSREFIRRLDASPDVHVAYRCRNMQEARNLMAKQEVKGFIYFPEDFRRKLQRGEQAQVSVFCDMTLMLAYKALYLSSVLVSIDMNSDIQKERGGNITTRDEEIATQPMIIEEQPIFNTTGGYGNAILPGVLIIILQQTLLLGIGLSAGTARENNRYQDLVPISKHYNGILKIVLGKSFCYFMIYSVMAAYLTLVVPKMFGFTTLSSPSDLFGLLLPYLLATIFFGMTLSCMIRYRENVILLAVFTSVPFLFLTGLSWPESNISGVWKGISLLIPSTFGVQGFLGISSMGATLQDVHTEHIALWVLAGCYFLSTCLVYRYQIIRARRHAIAHVRDIQDKIRKERLLRENAEGKESE